MSPAPKSASEPKRQRENYGVGGAGGSGGGGRERAMEEEKENRCQFFLPSKRRFCANTPLSSTKFCGNHNPSTKSQRLPCPIDPSHSVLRENLDSHVKKCPFKKQAEALETNPYYSKGINGGGGAPEEEKTGSEAKRRAVHKLSLDEFDRLIGKIRAFRSWFQVELLESFAEPDACKKWLNQQSDRQVPYQEKHVMQQISILGNMETFGILKKPLGSCQEIRECDDIGGEKDEAKAVIEFGAGRGYLTHMLADCYGLKKIFMVERRSYKLKVAEALGTLKFPYVYPDPESRRLRAALAVDSGLESDYILAGCGADELNDLIMRCVLDPGDKIVDCPPTFTMYEFDAAVNGVLVIKVPRLSNFTLDVPHIVEVIEQERPKCIFLTSPNNPDGSIINDEDLLKILNQPILVVLDEAYIEFSGMMSRMDWVKNHENLIVLRTFSKRAGLAGLRVGYGAFPLSIIEYLWRAKQPYNVSVAAEVSACAALQNPGYLESVKNSLVQERERLYNLLKEVSYLKPYQSYSNFILCEVKSGKDPKKLKEDLAQMGVMIRHYNNKELRGYVRISVGKPEHTDTLMKCLKLL